MKGFFFREEAFLLPEMLAGQKNLQFFSKTIAGQRLSLLGVITIISDNQEEYYYEK